MARLFLRSSFLALLIYAVSASKITIGALFDDQATLRTIQQSFNSIGTKEGNSFELLTERVDPIDPYLTSKAAIRLLKKNALVLIAPSTSGGYSVLPSLSTNVQVPLISLSERLLSDINHQEYLINLQPETLKATLEVLRIYKWNSIVYFYDRSDGPDRADYLKQMGFGDIFSEITAQYKITHVEQFMIYLRDYDLDVNILLDVEPSLAEDILKRYVSNDKKINFFLMNPMDDSFWKKNREERYDLKVTGFQVYDLKSDDVSRTIKSFGKSDRSKTRAFLAIDVVTLIEDGLSRLVQTKQSLVDDSKGFFFNASSKLLEGETVKQFILQTVVHDGLTGPVYFDHEGRRKGYTISVFEIQQNQLKESFSWNEQNGLVPINGSNFAPKSNLSGKKIKVTTIIQEPYMMVEKNSAGQDVFKGFCNDLMILLSELHGFEYEFKLVADGRYGTRNEIGKWNGMIGEVVDKQADMACSDITITSNRKEAVDFSLPFHTAGISLLVKRPDLASAIGPGSCDYFFFRVFTPEAWGCLVSSIIIAGLLYFAISRLTDTTVDLGTGNRISVGLLSSLWFAFVSILLRGVTKHASSTSARVVSSIWWLFVLFSLTIYLGGLTAMLLAHHFGNPVLEFQEKVATKSIASFIEEALDKNYPQVGLVQGGSTRAFFKYSNVAIYERYNSYLEANPDAMTVRYQDGIERVLDGDYAFLMDSTMSTFHVERNCDLVMHANLEYKKGLGLALAKNSPYTNDLNVIMLNLIEKGDIQKLHNRWFLHNVTCPKPESSYRDLYHSSMTLQNIGGLFYCLVVGIILTFFVLATEYCIERRKRPEVSLTRVKRSENAEEQDQRTFL